MCVPQKLLVSHPYKNVMTFGGCKQDFMLVVGQNVGTGTTKDKATTKHVFAMDASKVSDATRPLYSDLLRWNRLQEVLREPHAPGGFSVIRNRPALTPVPPTGPRDHPPNLQLHQQCPSSEGHRPPHVCPRLNGGPAHQPEE